MIIGKLKDLKRYKGLTKNLDTAIDYALSPAFAKVEDGKHEIDGKNVYIMMSSYIAKPIADCKGETHKDYLDLQIVVEGSEGFGYADASNPTLKVTDKYDAEKDIEKYTCTDECVYTMTKNSFAIVFPEDVHRPKIKINDSNVKKAVIKIKI